MLLKRFHYLIKDGNGPGPGTHEELSGSSNEAKVNNRSTVQYEGPSPTSSITHNQRRLILQSNDYRLKPRPTKRHSYSISRSSCPSGPCCRIYEYGPLPPCHFFSVHTPCVTSSSDCTSEIFPLLLGSKASMYAPRTSWMCPKRWMRGVSMAK